MGQLTAEIQSKKNLVKQLEEIVKCPGKNEGKVMVIG